MQKTPHHTFMEISDAWSGVFMIQSEIIDIMFMICAWLKWITFSTVLWMRKKSAQLQQYKFTHYMTELVIKTANKDLSI